MQKSPRLRMNFHPLLADELHASPVLLGPLNRKDGAIRHAYHLPTHSSPNYL